MSLIRSTKLTKLRLEQLKQLTGFSHSKLVEIAVLNNLTYIQHKKIKKK